MCFHILGQANVHIVNNKKPIRVKHLPFLLIAHNISQIGMSVMLNPSTFDINQTCCQQAKEMPICTPCYINTCTPPVPQIPKMQNRHCYRYEYFWVLDYYFKFPVICKLDSMTTKHVTCYIQAIFSKHEWPETFVSDNSSYFAACEFKWAKEEMGAHHITKSTLSPLFQCTCREVCLACKRFAYQGQHNREKPLSIHYAVNKHTTQLQD